jgi:GTPase SAR1 family protein
VAVVTGFYGSGKTSLLHRLAAKLVAPSSSPLSIALLLHSLSEGTPSHAPNPTPSYLLPSTRKSLHSFFYFNLSFYNLI